MMKKLFIIFGVIVMPSIAFAAGELFTKVSELLNSVIPIIITIAVIYFLWGVGKYIMSSGDSEKQEEARGMMIYGIIGLFVMVSVWGLVNILVQTVGLDSGAIPNLPQVPSTR
ncbi:MAG: hypothetical protein HYT28_03045 [Parcubacteria group bacterium]|nr:hypothetical protein [Parcubacteria group bacterium]